MYWLIMILSFSMSLLHVLIILSLRSLSVKKRWDGQEQSLHPNPGISEQNSPIDFATGHSISLFVGKRTAHTTPE